MRSAVCVLSMLRMESTIAPTGSNEFDFGGCQKCADVVGWMARFFLRDESVHEIQIPDQGAVIEGRALWTGRTPADKRTRPAA